MPVIKILKPRPQGDQFEVETGTNLMQALLTAGLPVASSCRGDGVCGKCRIQILEGQKNLSPETDLEKFLRNRHDLEKSERVSCQVQVLGDVTVATGYW